MASITSGKDGRTISPKVRRIGRVSRDRSHSSPDEQWHARTEENARTGRRAPESEYLSRLRRESIRRTREVIYRRYPALKPTPTADPRGRR